MRVKRVAVGVVWCFGLWLAFSAILGAIAGYQTTRPGLGQAKSDQFATVTQGYTAGREAGVKMGREFGGRLLLGAAVISFVGTALGILPGTRSRNKDRKDESGNEG